MVIVTDNLVCHPGQTEFPLRSWPAQMVELCVNGLVQRPGQDYVPIPPTGVVRWVSRDHDLDVTDVIQIAYQF